MQASLPFSTKAISLGLLIVLCFWTPVGAQTTTLIFTCGGCAFLKTAEGVLHRQDASGSTCDPSSCSFLEFHGQGLTELSAGVFDGFGAVTVMWLQENQLSSLPSGLFATMASLQTLNLSMNQLSSLPSGVFDGLASLQLILVDTNLPCYPALVSGEYSQFNSAPFTPSSICPEQQSITSSSSTSSSSSSSTSSSSSSPSTPLTTPSPIPLTTPSPTPVNSSQYNATYAPWLSSMVAQAFSPHAACEETRSWKEILAETRIADKAERYTSGGLGSFTIPSRFGIWVCWRNHPCIGAVNGAVGDRMCYVKNKVTDEWHAWGLSSVLGLCNA